MISSMKQSLDECLEHDHIQTIERVFDRLLKELDKEVGLELLGNVCGNSLYEYMETQMASSIARSFTLKR